METRDTITAPATPMGEGGVGIVRLSGPQAEPVLHRFFRSTRSTSRLASHRFYHGRIFSALGEPVDEVMAVVMRAPHSYTREDVVEIHCHGGPLVVRRILDLLLEAGVRLARPGEFTLRAFLNGRLDLTQAEAVIDLIRARSDAALTVALRQLDGRLSSALHGFASRLTDLLALVEAQIDFSEEEIELPAMEQLQRSVREVVEGMEALLATFDSGRVLREGLSVLILGRPNVGKSSLLNALLGEARAIVADIPGTTRDTIEESLVLDGMPLRLVDTAGVRVTCDPVEVEGVRRARQKAASADLVLLVVDGSQPVGVEDHLALEFCGDARVLLVANKADLPPAPLVQPFDGLPVVRVSSHTGAGLDELRQTIAGFFAASGADGRESILLADRRHREALLRSRQALTRFLAGLDTGLSPELLALELREALQGLGEITGETTPDDILERIFTRFCIGK